MATNIPQKRSKPQDADSHSFSVRGFENVFLSHLFAKTTAKRRRLEHNFDSSSSPDRTLNLHGVFQGHHPETEEPVIKVSKEAFFDYASEQIERALRVILKSPLQPAPYKYPIGLSKQRLYRLITNLSDLGMQNKLATLMRKVVEEYVAEIIAANKNDNDQLAILRAIVDYLGETFVRKCDIISPLFDHFNATFGHKKSGATAKEVLLKAVDDCFKQEANFVLIASAITTQVQNHRNGVDQTEFFNGLLQSFIKLRPIRSMKDGLVEQLLKQCNEYHAQLAKSKNNGNTDDIADYIKAKIDLERSIASFFTGFADIASPLAVNVILNFVGVFAQIIDKFVGDTEVLSTMYKIMKDQDKIVEIAENIRKSVACKGGELVKDDTIKNQALAGLAKLATEHGGTNKAYEDKLKTVAPKILDLVYAYESACRISFQMDSVIYDAMLKGLHSFICTSPKNEVLFLRIFTEYMIQEIKSNVDLPKLQRDANSFGVIIKLCQQHSVFTDNYSFALGKRLLDGSSYRYTQLGREEAVVNELLKNVPLENIFSIRRMLEDVKTKSKIIYDNFKNSSHASGVSLDLNQVNVTILSEPEWPEFAASSSNLKLPREIEAFEKNLQEFFKSSNNEERELFWPESLGTWNLKAQFAGGEKEIVGSKAQITVLMLFSEKDTLTVEEIKEGSGMSDPSIVLTSLVEHKLLIKNSENYSVNNVFTNPEYRVNIYDVKYEDLLKVKEPIKLTAIDRNKKQVQAAVVRLLKSAYNAGEKSNPDEHKQYSKEELFTLSTTMASKDFTMANFEFCLEGLCNSKHIKKTDESGKIFEYLP